MANLMDYLDWRGDVALDYDGFNEVDGLLFAELSFIDFTDIVPDVGGGSVPLREAAQRYFDRAGGEETDLGVLVPDRIPEMMRRMALSRRFSGVRLSCCEATLDEEREQQFAALTAELGDGTVYCAFRGTDDTLVGWKEDFNMGFLETIPSQASALDYLTRVARQYPAAQLRIGGHSKGGNLAVYAAVFVPEEVQRRIVQVYNNDGPGFNRDLTALPEHARIAGRILSVMPQSSIVGMMLAHERNAEVVHSTASGIAQHNGFTWEVRGTRFVHLDGFSAEGKRTEETLESFAAELSPEQRQTFVNALFEVLSGTGARTLSDLNEEKIRSAAGMLKTYQNLDEETRSALSGAMKLLFRINARNVLSDAQEAGEKGWDALKQKADELLGRLLEKRDEKKETAEEAKKDEPAGAGETKE